MSSSKVEQSKVPATTSNASLAGRFPARVVKVIDPKKIAINRGISEGVQVGQRFVVYALDTDELHDPETGASLGRLELVKGTAVVAHVQDHIATLISDIKHKTGGERRIVRKSPFGGLISNLNSLNMAEEIIIPPWTEVMEFEDASEGDFVKPI